MNIDCERKPSGNEKRTDVNATGLLNYLPKCETIVSSWETELWTHRQR